MRQEQAALKYVGRVAGIHENRSYSPLVFNARDQASRGTDRMVEYSSSSAIESIRLRALDRKLGIRYFLSAMDVLKRKKEKEETACYKSFLSGHLEHTAQRLDLGRKSSCRCL